MGGVFGGVSLQSSGTSGLSPWAMRALSQRSFAVTPSSKDAGNSRQVLERTGWIEQHTAPPIVPSSAMQRGVG